MAVHDHERLPRDGIQDAPNRHTAANSSTPWVGIAIGSAIIALILYMIFSAMGPTRTGDGIRNTPQTPTTTTAPRTTTPTPTAPTTQPR